MSVADIERGHNKHKRLLTKGQGFAALPAKSQLESFRAQATQAARALGELKRALLGANALPAASLPGPGGSGAAAEPRGRALSAYEIFLEEKKRELKAVSQSAKGLYFNKAGKSAARQV